MVDPTVSLPCWADPSVMFVLRVVHEEFAYIPLVIPNTNEAVCS